jgi:hypothetical protein
MTICSIKRITLVPIQKMPKFILFCKNRRLKTNHNSCCCKIEDIKWVCNLKFYYRVTTRWHKPWYKRVITKWHDSRQNYTNAWPLRTFLNKLFNFKKLCDMIRFIVLLSTQQNRHWVLEMEGIYVVGRDLYQIEHLYRKFTSSPVMSKIRTLKMIDLCHHWPNFLWKKWNKLTF